MFTAQWFRCGGLRCSPLNAALVAKAKNAAKAECLGLVFVHFWLGFVFQILVFMIVQIRLWFFVVGLSVSEADSLVESQLCDIVFSNELFSVVGPFSTAF
ncbi:hypothetical protein P7M41_24915 [Vibrio parahaemolyticus]|nr:hypothetical protein [Vibrio parahaemolyticus]MDF4264759.1 hypothetical protein [Vibrio parahaemolyticus]MDF4326696.1 hypothetical protein [Vibrio parahaemolyticus]MDG2555263.1 hypothetical protein [Vibrio parahaemolyticus]